jgi:hypothetical protein
MAGRDLYSGMDLSLGPNGATDWFGLLNNMWGPQTQGGGSQEELLRALIGLERERIAKQPTVEEAYMAKARARAPVATAIAEREASNVGVSPWGPGGLFEGRRAADLYTPEEIVASQGRTAENQIKSLRRPLPGEQAANLQNKVASKRGAGEFDPEELRRLNREYAMRRSYT